MAFMQAYTTQFADKMDGVHSEAFGRYSKSVLQANELELKLSRDVSKIKNTKVGNTSSSLNTKGNENKQQQSSARVVDI
jgi:hypothetical protein